MTDDKKNPESEDLERIKAEFEAEMQRFLANPDVPQDIKDEVLGGQSMFDFFSFELGAFAGVRKNNG